MGITNDERRRIAANLRESWKPRWHGEKMMHRLREALEIDRSASEYGKFRYYRTVADRLADLIEPEPERTCRVESSHEMEGDGCYAYFEYELTCGHEIARGDQLPPSYCPECGRRVLYDSNDYI